MNDTIKMFARYAVAIALSFAVAKGWFSEAAGGEISRVFEVILGAFAAFTPAIYAAYFVSNAPKK